MPKFNIAQNSFTSGEISDKFAGRTDLQQYFQSAEKIENFLVRKEGGVTRRMGTRFLATPTDFDNKIVTLIPFIPSETEAFVLVFADGATMEVYDTSDGTQMNVDLTKKVISGGDPTRINYVQSNDVLFLVFPEENFPMHIFYRKNDVDFVLEAFGHPTVGNLTEFSPQAVTDPVVKQPFLPENTGNNKMLLLDAVGAGGRIMNCEDSSGNAIPFFKPDMVFNSSSYGNYIKSADGTSDGFGYITTIDAPASDTNVDTADVDITNDELDITAHLFITGIEVKAKINTGSIVGGLTENRNYFVRDVGANAISLHPTAVDANANTNKVDLTAQNGGVTLEVIASPQADFTVVQDFPAGWTSAQVSYQISAWSDAFGHPKAVTIHQERLVAAGNSDNPDIVFGTQAGNPFWFLAERHFIATAGTPDLNYTGSTVETDAYQYIVGQRSVNSIQWLSATRNLQAGTLSTEFVMDEPDSGVFGALTPPRIRAVTQVGSTSVQPAPVGNSLLFVSANGKQVHDFFFDGQIRGFDTNDLNTLNSDIFKQNFDADNDTLATLNIKQVAWQQSRKVVWMVTTNGSLISLTLNKENAVIGWCKHNLGQHAADSNLVLGVAVVPNSTADGDEVILIVDRGTLGIQLEKIGPDFEHDILSNSSGSLDDKPWFLDFAERTTTGSPQTSFTFSSIFSGLTVNVLADGFNIGSKTLSGTTLTLDDAAEEVIIGFTYTSTLSTNKVEAGSAIGSAIGQTKRIDRATIRFYKTYGAKFGRDESNLEEIEFRDVTLGQSNQLELFTGDKRLDFPGNYDEKGQVTVQTSLPFPCSVISITMRGVSSE